MSEKQYRLNKWGTRLLRNNRPLFDWTNEGDYIVDLLNELSDENEQLKQQLKLEEAEERINCRNCIYFISGSSSDSCLKREDIGYKGTCIDGMDYHYLAKNCPYY